ncbi:MAG: TIR domain-containing protein [Solirubrobacterales bacterium]|nr:TIR domain-containing protein [Solirubrobacterales bacterium]
MASRLSQATKHRCFISYHHADEVEVERFINTFDHGHDVFVSRGIGASMPGDVIESTNADYIKRRIREQYLNNTSVTIVLVGACTWSRRFVDWEIAASLRKTATSAPNGLMAITLPSVASNPDREVPARFDDNLDYDRGYARWWKYPSSTDSLASMIEDAFRRRTSKANLIDNSRQLFGRNRIC